MVKLQHKSRADATLFQHTYFQRSFQYLSRFSFDVACFILNELKRKLVNFTNKLARYLTKLDTKANFNVTKSDITYSSTDIWKPQIHVYDWLICCSGNLILYQKRNENDKNRNFMMKNSKKMSKKHEVIRLG